MAYSDSSFAILHFEQVRTQTFVAQAVYHEFVPLEGLEPSRSAFVARRSSFELQGRGQGDRNRTCDDLTVSCSPSKRLPIRLHPDTNPLVGGQSRKVEESNPWPVRASSRFQRAPQPLGYTFLGGPCSLPGQAAPGDFLPPAARQAFLGEAAVQGAGVEPARLARYPAIWSVFRRPHLPFWYPCIGGRADPGRPTSLPGYTGTPCSERESNPQPTAFETVASASWAI